MESSLLLSIREREPEARKRACEQARQYGEAALNNVFSCDDECMVAQVEFLLACVSARKVYLQAKINSSVRTEGVESLMREKLGALSKFPHLDMDGYEAQADIYLGYLDKVT